MAGRSTHDAFSLAWLREQYPSIAWEAPNEIHGGYTCRVCVASYGLKHNSTFQTIEEFNAHMAQKHVRHA